MVLFPVQAPVSGRGGGTPFWQMWVDSPLKSRLEARKPRQEPTQPIAFSDAKRRYGGGAPARCLVPQHPGQVVHRHPGQSLGYPAGSTSGFVLPVCGSISNPPVPGFKDERRIWAARNARIFWRETPCCTTTLPQTTFRTLDSATR